jgi:plastocyanin
MRLTTIPIGIVMLVVCAFTGAETRAGGPTVAPAAFARAVGPVAAHGANPHVKLTNFKFEPKVLTVKAGTTVEWVNEGGRHTIEADNGSFKSDVLTQGGKFEHKFVKPGTYAYHCGFHGEKGGKDMSGKIVVTR